MRALYLILIFLHYAYMASIFARELPTVNLNFESLKALDNLIVQGYQDWVNTAPPDWKTDGFLLERSPIIVTSRYGQNAAIALPGNERQEAAAWQLDRDYSKIAFLTVAIATSIKYVHLRIHSFLFNRSINFSF